MARSVDRLRWSGSLEAIREHEKAVASRKPAAKPKKKKNRRRPSQPQPRRVNYEQYLQSKAWQRKRRKKFKQVGRQCQRCGSTYRLQVHHKTYERLGQEPLADLEVLCLPCHENAHILDRTAEARIAAILQGE